MYAWRKATMTSKPVNATSMKNENGHTTISRLAVKSVMVSTEKVTRRMWPASMLAKRRTASEKGRTRNVDTNSIGTTSSSNAFGTPGGANAFQKYFNPLCFTPTPMKTSHEM